MPHVFERPDEIAEFPVFAKPDRSQGSRGAVAGRRRDRAGGGLGGRFGPGHGAASRVASYTVDCFSDRDRGVLFARARARERTRAGISMATRTEPTSELAERDAKAIGARLALHGAWFFQLREDRHGEPRLLEVAPRVAGTSALHRVLGVNFALLSVYEHLRIPVTVAPNDIDIRLDRALVNRYAHDLEYGHVYVDLDDTLLVGDAVNTRLVALLYQCLNEGRRLVLITRHARDVSDDARALPPHGAVGRGRPRRPTPATRRPPTSGAGRDPDRRLVPRATDRPRAARDRHFDSSMIELLLDGRL